MHRLWRMHRLIKQLSCLQPNCCTSRPPLISLTLGSFWSIDICHVSAVWDVRDSHNIHWQRLVSANERVAASDGSRLRSCGSCHAQHAAWLWNACAENSVMEIGANTGNSTKPAKKKKKKNLVGGSRVPEVSCWCGRTVALSGRASVLTIPDKVRRLSCFNNSVWAVEQDEDEKLPLPTAPL